MGCRSATHRTKRGVPGFVEGAVLACFGEAQLQCGLQLAATGPHIEAGRNEAKRLADDLDLVRVLRVLHLLPQTLAVVEREGGIACDERVKRVGVVGRRDDLTTELDRDVAVTARTHDGDLGPAHDLGGEVVASEVVRRGQRVATTDGLHEALAAFGKGDASVAALEAIARLVEKPNQDFRLLAETAETLFEGHMGVRDGSTLGGGSRFEHFDTDTGPVPVCIDFSDARVLGHVGFPDLVVGVDVGPLGQSGRGGRRGVRLVHVDEQRGTEADDDQHEKHVQFHDGLLAPLGRFGELHKMVQCFQLIVTSSKH